MHIAGADTAIALLQTSFAAFRRPAAVTLTLDLLRSELSHESSAKIARLRATCVEWESGRYRHGDVHDLCEILAALENLVLSHARVAALSVASLVDAARVIASVRSVRRMIRPVERGSALSLQAVRRVQREIERLRERTAQMVDRLSRRYGMRIAEVVIRATDEIRRESGAGLAPGSVRIVLDDHVRSGGGWVTRGDAVFWADVMRNLIRNAVEATQDKLAAEPRAGSSCAEGLPVMVGLRPAASGMGTVVEVTDFGVGMSPQEMERSWTAGASRHGAGRGQGLTEGKWSYAVGRAEIHTRSAPAAGTTVTLSFPFQPITLPPIRLYHVRPAYALLLLPAAVLAANAALSNRADLAMVVQSDATALRGSLTDGRAWVVDLEAPIMVNNPFGSLYLDKPREESCVPLVLRLQGRRAVGVVVSTGGNGEQGKLHFLDASGRTRRIRPLVWGAPAGYGLHDLRCHWQQQVEWDPGGDPAVAVQVRDADHGCCSIQFFTATGDSLGAYCHPGHLGFKAARDLDGDGRIEVLLHGINDTARTDPTFLPRPQSEYVDCLALLEIPRVNGQAYPYRQWPGMPAASEEAYLLFPPLRDGVRPEICRIDIGAPASGLPCQIEVLLGDGRIYQLNEHLRPVACRVGDGMLAQSLAPTWPIAPLAYFAGGNRESIDLQVLEGLYGSR